MKIILIFSILFLIVRSSYEAIPADLELCKFADVTCIAQAITTIANGNPHGRKDLNLPNLEPLHVNALNIGQGGRGGLNLNIQLKNVDLYGLSTIKIDRAVGFDTDPKSSKYEIYAHIPQIKLKGNYKADGRILVLPIQGEGPFDFVLDAVKVSIKIKPQVYIKNGKSHITIEKLKLLLEPSKLSVRLDNLFNGDAALSQNMHTFLNENWMDVWADISSDINAGMGEVIRVIISNVFKIAPYDNLFRNE